MDKKIVDRMLNPSLMRFFYTKSLPGALFFGLKVSALDDQHAIVEVPYRWSTKNPFQSIYFAALAAASELSTGCIAMAAVEGKNISMLVTNMEGSFSKKAKERIYFECNEVKKVLDGVHEAETTGNGVVIRLNTIGKTKDGSEVARFVYEWSLKKKTKKN